MVYVDSRVCRLRVLAGLFHFDDVIRRWARHAVPLQNQNQPEQSVTMRLTSAIIYAFIVVVLAACSAPEPWEQTRDLFTDGELALEEDRLDDALAIADELAAEPLGAAFVPYFRGMVTYRRDGLEAADEQFGNLYNSLYDRFVLGYAELTLEERQLSRQAHIATYEAAMVYSNENKHSSYKLFSLLLDDIDYLRAHGAGAGFND